MTDLIEALRVVLNDYEVRCSDDALVIIGEAADELSALREHVRALLDELDKTERRSCKAAGLARAALAKGAE